MRRATTLAIFAASALMGAPSAAQVRDTVAQAPAPQATVSRGYSAGYSSTPNRRHRDDDPPVVQAGTGIRDTIDVRAQRNNNNIFRGSVGVTFGGRRGGNFGRGCYRGFCNQGSGYYNSYYAVPVYVERNDGPDFNATPSAYTVYGGNIPPEYIAPGAAAVEAAYRQGQLEQRITSLADEVARLRAEKAEKERGARAESFANAGTETNEPGHGPSAAATATLVFRNGQRLDIANYAIVGQTLWVFDEQRARRIPLTDLDLAATKKVNAENGYDFKVPAAK